MEEIKVISDVDAIKALSDSFRLKILKILQNEGSASATHIADKMSESASKISYHIKILEKHNIIKLKETRIKGNMVEKIYAPVANEFKLQLKKASEKGEIDGSELMPFARELSSSIEKDLLKLAKTDIDRDEDSPSILSYGSYFLSEDEVKELSEHILSKLRVYMNRRKGDIEKEHNEYKIAFLLLDHFAKD
ncbi:MAG: ArsR/SmtB family transcription factor [Halanaerobiales bacterium]